MKKSLSLLVAIAMVFSMFASVAFAADELTAEQKYEALVEAGIFEGFDDGEAHLDEAMTRAQAAKIIALLTGYTEETEVEDAGFTDLKGAGWAADYINYVAGLGIVEGMGDMKFAPSAEVTIEQLAKMVVETLEIEVDEEATVDGEVSDWAVAYVAAAVEAGLVEAQEDYTVSALRELLVVASFTAYELINPSALVVTSAAAVGAKKIEVKFSKAVDDTKASFAVKKGNSIASVSKVTFNEAKTVATLETSIALSAGDFTVTVGGLGIESGKDVASFSVTPERIEKVEVEENGYRTEAISATGHTAVEVGIKLLNQYGEEVGPGVAGSVYATSTTGTTATVSSNNKTVTVNNVANNTTTFNLTVVDAKFAKSETKTINVRLLKAIGEVVLGTPELPTGKTAFETGGTYTIPYTAKDQYGAEMTLDSPTAGLTYIPSDATILGAAPTLTADKKKLQITLGAFNGPKTLSLQVIVNATGKSSKIEFNAVGSKNIDSVTLVAPSTQIGEGEQNVKVELQAIDQYGNALTPQEIIDRAAELVVTEGNPAVFTVDKVGTTPVITKDGNKAYLTIDADDKGSAILIVSVKANAKNTNVSLTVVDAKYTAALTLKTDVTKAVYQAGITVKAEGTDQYGGAFNPEAPVVVVSIEGDGFTGAAGTYEVADLKADGVTFTAAKHDGTATVTYKLYKAGQVGDAAGLIDSKSVTLTSVKQDAALTYEIEDLGTLAAIANGVLSSPYAKTVKVVGKDSTGAKVALKSDAIQGVSAVDTTILATGVDAGAWKVAVKDGKEGDTQINVSIGKQDGTVVVQQAAVKASKAAPVAATIVAKQTDTEVSKVTVAAGTYDIFTKNANLWFEVKDQYGVAYNGVVGAPTAVFVTNPTGAISTDDEEVTFTVGTWKVNVVSGSKSVTVEVTVVTP